MEGRTTSESILDVLNPCRTSKMFQRRYCQILQHLCYATSIFMHWPVIIDGRGGALKSNAQFPRHFLNHGPTKVIWWKHFPRSQLGSQKPKHRLWSGKELLITGDFRKRTRSQRRKIAAKKVGFCVVFQNVPFFEKPSIESPSRVREDHVSVA